MLVAGLLSAVEGGADESALTGQILVRGELLAAENVGDDTADVAGQTVVAGALAITESGQDTASIRSVAGPLTPADVWGYVMANGATAETNLLALLAGVNVLLAGVNVQRINGAEVIGDGSEANKWRGVGVPPG